MTVGGIIATLREYQGQGHAMRLLHEGIKMADRDHGKWYAGCWPASAPLYGKVKGFEYVAEESIDMSQYGGSSPISMRLFIREPQDADMSI
jgi:GNAT superfamily N-acetyltransferase